MGRKCLGIYLGQASHIWRGLSPSARNRAAVRAWGAHLDRLTRLGSDRRQFFATFFLRNRPELELLTRLAGQQPRGARLNLTILACSKGAEVYSIAWSIRTARPDLDLRIQAVDISPEIVEFAARGVYSLDKADALDQLDVDSARDKGVVSWNTSRDQNASMFERVSPAEMESMFEVSGDHATVRPWLREGITWRSGDAADPALAATFGPQDIVVANRFLCHMEPPVADACLRNIARLVRPGGYLFVSGIDLDVRSGVAADLHWRPVTHLLREIHDGDTSTRAGWPLHYWGLEPLDDRRPDWQIRYASVFQLGEAAVPQPEAEEGLLLRGEGA